MQTSFKRLYHQKQWLLHILTCLALLLPNLGASPAYATALDAPAIQYIAASNLVVIGSTSGAPNASQIITVPDLATALTAQGLNNLLAQVSTGVWLLKAKVFINPTARLDATNATISELRLESTLSNFVNITASRGGYLLVDGIKVTSWDTTANALDQNTADGRAYLIAQEGGRMDILNSEVAYLGWAANEVSGLTWRKRLNPIDAATGATGVVQNSNIHDNYFGLFASSAYGIKVLGNQIYKNLGYGLDIRDSSDSLEIGGNNVYSNGDSGIVVERQSPNNQVHDNQVHDHGQDGIVLGQNAVNNVVRANTVFNNRNGVAISQASNNQVQSNNLHNNTNGVQVEAKFNASVAVDSLATANQIVSNTIDSNVNYGIYLYSRADRNTIANNTVTKSGINGIYIKTGGNLLRSNTVSNGVTGIVILNEPDPAQPGALAPLDPSAQNNVIVASTLTNNTDTGIRILGGVNNRIGADLNAPNAADGNIIQSNGRDGVAIVQATSGAASTNNLVSYNTIQNNGSRGVYLNGATTIGNRISHNSITGNVSLGIKLDNGAQQGIQTPVITGVLADGTVNGTAPANASIEVYTDPSGEGKTFLGATTAGANGAWSINLPGQDQKRLTALAIDGSGNTSQFSGSAGSTVGAIYHVNKDVHGQTTIEVTGNGAAVTLPDILTGLGVSNTAGVNVPLVQNLNNGVWRLNANLFIKDGVTLNVTSASTVNELQLRSQPGVAVASGKVAAANALSALSADTTTSDTALDDIAAAEISGTVNYTSFVYLRTHNGTINLDGVKVYSWDAKANAGAGDFDRDATNGRAYVIAKYASTLNINNSELSYLGSADTDSQGVTWRDVNDAAAPTTLLTRVSGTVQNSQFHHNYYGAYLTQAGGMTFQNNQFHDNDHYGFTLRDFTHDVTVENNVAFNNAGHGFYIVRGGTSIGLRNNKSYNNTDPSGTFASGFAMDPGSVNSDPSSPVDNTFDGNESYGNEGYGLRLQNANGNHIRNNNFHDNPLQGISVEQGSTQNEIISNTLSSNMQNGVLVYETADGNTLSNNNVNGNKNYGVYLRSNRNAVNGNNIHDNAKQGVYVSLTTGVSTVQENQLISNTVSNNGDSGIDLRGATHTTIQGNTIEHNTLHGIYLSEYSATHVGSSQNLITRNMIHANTGSGIKANAVSTVANTWSANNIYENVADGITLSSSANGGLLAPQLVSVVNRVVTGKTLKTGVTVEIFTDAGAQGQYYEGQTVSATGTFTFTLPDVSIWRSGKITAVGIDDQGNASPFSNQLAAPVLTPIIPTPTPVPGTTPTPSSSSVYLPVVQK